MNPKQSWRSVALDVIQALVVVDIAMAFAAGGWTLRPGPWVISSPGLGWSIPLLLLLQVGRYVPRTGLSGNAGSWPRVVVEHRWELALCALALVGLGLRFWGLRFGLPIMAHPDEPDAVAPALRMLQRGTLNPGWFYYPTLYMYLIMPFLALDFLSLRGSGQVASLADVSRFEPGLYVAARSVSAVVGALTIVPLYRAATVLWDGHRARTTGLIAATIVTFSFIHVRESHHAVTDALLTFMIAVALVPIGHILRRGAARDYLFAGLVAGLAGASKYSALPLVVVIAAAHLLGRPLREWISARPLLAGVGLGAGFLIGTPYALLNWPRFIDDLGFLRTITSNFTDPAERFGWIFGYSLESGFGIVIGAALWLSMLVAIYRRRPAELLLTVHIVAFIALITHGEIRMMGRYLLPALPATALLVAHYAVESTGWIREKLALPRLSMNLALAVVVAIAVLPTARESVQWARDRAQPDSRAALYEWAVENLPEGSLVHSEAWIRGVDRGIEFQRANRIELRIKQLQSRGIDVVVLVDTDSSAADSTNGGRARLRRKLVELAHFSGRSSGFTGPGLTAYAVPPPPDGVEEG